MYKHSKMSANNKNVQFDDDTLVVGLVDGGEEWKEDGSKCAHHCGQELCYLCHQRQRRNIPISFAEEKVNI